MSSISELTSFTTRKVESQAAPDARNGTVCGPWAFRGRTLPGPRGVAGGPGERSERREDFNGWGGRSVTYVYLVRFQVV